MCECDVWKTATKTHFFNTIGEIRWWAKDTALFNIFGHNNGIFVVLCQTLDEIAKSLKFNAEVRFKAQNLLAGFVKYETTITAIMFRRFFHQLLLFLSFCKHLEWIFLQAYRMVEETLQSLRNCQ